MRKLAWRELTWRELAGPPSGAVVDALPAGDTMAQADWTVWVA